MATIDELKARLPLPDLLRAMGLGEYAKKLCCSPLRQDKNPSWGIYQDDKGWHWKDSVSTPAWEEHWILKGFLHFVHPFSGVLLVRPTRMCILGQHRLMPMSNQAVTSALLAKSDSVDILRCIQVCILFVTTIQTLKL